MKCKQCGADLTADQVYCEVCGAEYQIVPDFEPELESSIATSLSGLTDSIQEHQEPKPEAARQPVSVLTWGAVPLVILVLILLLVPIYGNSVPAIRGKAQKAEEAMDYLEAASHYARLAEKEPQEADWIHKEAAMYLRGGEQDKALELYLKLLASGTDTIEIYEIVISLYLEQEEYQKVHELVEGSGNEVLAEVYSQYYAAPVEASHDSGFYDAAMEVALTANDTGAIYYTLDGTVPDEASTLYEEPIRLGNGNHRLQAVWTNRYGITSKTAAWDFEVEAAIPPQPVVKTREGTYESAVFIEVEQEEGFRVYYTTDGTTPTENSSLYKGPIPMPLGESTYTFAACSEDGVMGDTTSKTYLLNIKTGITTQEGEDLLVQALIQAGFLLDKNGALREHYGVHRYFYLYPLQVQEEHYYIFEERYLENEINRPTGILYAVDVKEGDCYHFSGSAPDSYELKKIHE